MKMLCLDDIDNSAINTMHLLKLIHNARGISGDQMGEILIEKVCESGNAIRIIPINYGRDTCRIIKYDRIWLGTTDKHDEAILYLQYKDLIDLRVPKDDFVNLYKLHKSLTSSTSSAILLAMAGHYQGRKYKGNIKGKL